MNKVTNIIKTIPLQKLRDLRDQITHRYKSKQGKGIQSADEAIAYLAFRSPATSAVQKQIFTECPKGSFHPESMVDLGAGMGLSQAIAAGLFPSLRTYTGIEENSYMVEMGRKLSDEIDWIQQSYLAADIPKADIILGSYTFSELSKTKLMPALEKAWAATQQCLILIEPGTPEGFKTILKCREYLVQNSGHIYAPCGHNGNCPINPENDWCHFSKRLERTKLHRDMKEGSLPYEDEKYCYLIATKENWSPTYKRILKPATTRKGHIKLDLCTPDKVESPTFTKSKKPNFKEIKKLTWGDRLE